MLKKRGVGGLRGTEIKKTQETTIENNLKPPVTRWNKRDKIFSCKIG